MMIETSQAALQAATYKRQFSEANSRAKNLTFRLSALQARFDGHVEYAVDLARIIESLSTGTDITVPQTTARFHYEMAVGALSIHREVLAALKGLLATVSADGTEAQALAMDRAEAAIAQAETAPAQERLTSAEPLDAIHQMHMNGFGALPLHEGSGE